jgi:hypothetical protein
MQGHDQLIHANDFTLFLGREKKHLSIYYSKSITQEVLLAPKLGFGLLGCSTGIDATYTRMELLAFKGAQIS